MNALAADAKRRGCAAHWAMQATFGQVAKNVCQGCEQVVTFIAVDAQHRT
ncbi:MAG TPA: hypothetical protein VJV79_14335 [Polyangiaceae bacterium]|nr:hypothetical protein [Polyangiaceae bacterium]